MKNWDNLQVKITLNERKIIEKHKKNQHIQSDGDFLRRAIEDFLGISLADAKRKENRTLPLEYMTMYYFYEYCKKEFKSSPRIQKKLNELFKKWASGYWRIQSRKHNEKLGRANEMWDHFKKHEKIGRPKKPKRKRGRPKRSET